jgi:site-specific DNA-adenine methylase
VIESFGPHKVSLGSVMGPQVDELLRGAEIDLLYTDPPWGDRYLAMFATHTAKATGRKPDQPSFKDLTARLASLIRQHVKGFACVEMSNAEADGIETMLKAVCPFGVVRKQAVYAGKYNQVVLIGGVAKPVPEIDIAGFKGQSLVTQIVSSLVSKGASVFDPFCGAGYTAQAAKSCGCSFYGNELNPARLAKTIARIK